MGQAHPSAHHDESKADLPAPRHDTEKPDITKIQQENMQLRELAVQLSKLVLKIVVK